MYFVHRPLLKLCDSTFKLCTSDSTREIGINRNSYKYLVKLQIDVVRVMKGDTRSNVKSRILFNYINCLEMK